MKFCDDQNKILALLSVRFCRARPRKADIARCRACHWRRRVGMSIFARLRMDCAPFRDLFAGFYGATWFHENHSPVWIPILISFPSACGVRQKSGCCCFYLA